MSEITVVFVHGAWVDASSWNGVIERLHGEGFNVRAVPNPLRGPSSDAAYVARILKTISGPIILVGHSYGGAVVTNAGTGNLSGFAVAQDGSASLLDADGVTAVTGGNPTDVAVSHNSRFLYARVAATNSIAVFAISADGSLEPLPSLTGTPAGLVGLAAY